MNEQKIQEVMEQYTVSGEMPGGSLSVHKRGELVYQNCWGIAEEDTIYRMASISKIFTAIGFMKLYEKGKVGLDDPVSKYLPAYESMMAVEDERFMGLEAMIRFMKTRKAPRLEEAKLAPAERQITVRDLLTHSSGIGMGLYGTLAEEKMRAEGWKDDDLEKRVDRYSRTALGFQPGTQTGYSPLAGFDLIARIVEVVTGRRFSEYMREEVFVPLEMTDAAYHLSREQKSRLIPLYSFEGGKMADDTGSGADVEGTAGSAYDSGSMGVYCSAEDLDHVAQMLGNNGNFRGKQILLPGTVQMLQTEHAYRHLEPEPGMEWGLGVMVRQDPEAAKSFAAKGTYGWSGSFGTHLFVSPEDDLAVSFCMNRSNIGGAGSYISRKVEELVFGIWG